MQKELCCKNKTDHFNRFSETNKRVSMHISETSDHQDRKCGQVGAEPSPNLCVMDHDPRYDHRHREQHECDQSQDRVMGRPAPLSFRAPGNVDWRCQRTQCVVLVLQKRFHFLRIVHPSRLHHADGYQTHHEKEIQRSQRDAREFRFAHYSFEFEEQYQPINHLRWLLKLSKRRFRALFCF